MPQIAKDIGLKVNTMSSNTIGGWGDSISANSTMNVRGSNQAIKGYDVCCGFII